MRSRTEIRSIRRAPRSSGGAVWVRSVPASEVAAAFVVPTRVGTAVTRNRVKRRLRAAVDELDRAGRVEPGRYLVGATPPSASADYQQIRADLATALDARRD